MLLRHKVLHRGDGDHETAAPSRPHVHAACGRRGPARLGHDDGACGRTTTTGARGSTAFRSAIGGRTRDVTSTQGNTRTIAARWGLQIADYYAPLVRKYRRAMWRPWISVDYEPPFFYPGPPPPRSLSDRPTSGNPPERAAGNSIRPADSSSERQGSVPRRQRLSATRRPRPGQATFNHSCVAPMQRPGSGSRCASRSDDTEGD